MTDTTEIDGGSEPQHWLPKPEESRQVISLILEGGFDSVRDLCESAPEVDGMEPVEMALTCLAMEAVRNGCAVVELTEEVEVLKGSLRLLWALTNGLFDAPVRDRSEDGDGEERDPDFEAVLNGARSRGRELRDLLLDRVPDEVRCRRLVIVDQQDEERLTAGRFGLTGFGIEIVGEDREAMIHMCVSADDNIGAASVSVDAKYGAVALFADGHKPGTMEVSVEPVGRGATRLTSDGVKVAEPADE
jgi:hypothetical protein